MEEKLAGIILAGGKSSRFGKPKAFAQREGLPFYQYSINALTPHTDELLIVTSPELQQRFQADSELQVAIDVELYRGEGPLAGIYTGMGAMKAEWYLTLPIDVPFVGKDIFSPLVRQIHPGIQAVVPVTEKKEQPLFAVWHHSVKGIIAEQLNNRKRSVHQLLERLDIREVKMEVDKPFVNINRQEDYEQHIHGDHINQWEGDR
ncbi:molybdenum cofactor guanylyltransferase [Virgibacillus xinjiangensis]|uniref:Probable molybdenum cofactor guanylyltransferase n=1 Tax=Virgibacillus xinjiangensis TaxID=393090 RepID=A0ABV7CW76_9BACI